MIPRATYRLQFHAGFTFADAARLAPYLARLGISHVYASPIAAARPGSAHGYDVIDPAVINPELGGEEGFRAMAAALKAEDLGIVLDIVPNHMAVGGSDNRFWADVLRHGEASEWARLFDIDWRGPDPALQGKVLAPVLGTPYAQALDAGDIALGRDAEGGPAIVLYGSAVYPLRPQDEAAALAGEDLHALLERQHYRLAWWRTAGDQINWRRFFEINELAGLRVEDPEVFDLVHALPLRLYAEGLLDGLRVDHVDGLADPAGYCRRLRAALDAIRPGAWLVVEKILAPGEALSADWGVDGTTGYDFMDEAALLLHAPEGAEPLARHWAALSGRPAAFEPEARAARAEILQRHFAGQLDAAARAFLALARADVRTRDVTLEALRRALVALLTVFPVYRTYATADGLPGADQPVLAAAARAARPLAAREEAWLLDQLAAWLGGKGPPALRAEAARRLQQLSAPVSAKAVEDTAFYRYGRLLSRNDVGFDPGRLSAPLQAFHAAAEARLARFPHAMLTAATHDHKRGEDVTARLAVLSERPELWIERSRRWMGLSDALDPGDRYMLLQTLAGSWPLDARPDLDALRQRVGAWLVKALREAKLRTSWAAPDEAYEASGMRLLDTLLSSSDFLAEMHGMVEIIAPAAALNTLSSTLLRCTAPGVPDLYQGCEFWDLSLVDPDNRRPVDYAARAAALQAGEPPEALLPHWRDGRVKQALIARALGLRAELPQLFAEGDYVPLQVEGLRAGSVLAFLRRHGEDAVLVAAAVRCAGALEGAELPLPSADWWGDTRTVGPAERRVADLLARLPVALERL
jgi:malto-oligosyltrehalose synthase